MEYRANGNEKVSIRVLNMSGQVVSASTTYTVVTGTNLISLKQFNTAEMESSVYFVRLTDEAGESHTARIVVK